MSDAAQHAIAGTGGALIATILLAPLDTIRTKLQADDAKGGILTVVKDAVHSDRGILSLYAGLYSALVSVGTSQAIYFYCYNAIKSAVLPGDAVGGARTLVVAYVAGALNAVVTCPLWTVTTRMKLQAMRKRDVELPTSDLHRDTEVPTPDPDSTDPTLAAKWSTVAVSGDSSVDRGRSLAEAKGEDEYKGVLDGLHKLWVKEGTSGMFNGLGPALVLCTNPAIQFYVYETLKQRTLLALKARRPEVKHAGLTSLQSFCMGAFAKAVATVLTYPVQVVQTRAQKSSGQGILTVLKALVDEGGLSGLFRGMRSKLLQTVLNSALIFLIYERLLRIVKIGFAIARNNGSGGFGS